MSLRLSPRPGEWIDRTQPLAFTFEGQDYQGFAGDTLSSALYAAGQKVIGRSFKYHRPRSILSLANHDANLLLQRQDGDYALPNLRADVAPLTAGMVLSAVNTFGGLDGDVARFLGAFSRFLPVGFYYKAFHTKRLFPLWERLFRYLTGLGTVDLNTPRLRTPKQYEFCDVLVIGAGPSGLAAARAAAAQGATVVIVDENARAGGSGSYQPGVEVDALLAELSAQPRIRVFTGTCAAAYYADHWVPLVDGEKLTKMRAGAVVVATGAFEQPAVFRNNDLPGVMLASAAQRLLHRYAVRPCQRAVVLAGNADGYRAVLDLQAQGIEVAALLDLRETPPCSELTEAVAAAGVRVLTGHCIVEALPGRGSASVSAVRVASFHDGEAGTATEDIVCDGVLLSVGWAPAANLLYQAGTRMRYERALEQFVPATLPAGVFACGRVNGIHEPAARLLDGERAGSAAAAHAGFGAARAVAIPASRDCPSHPWPIVDHPGGKNFVDFDEDLQLRDFYNAVQEGFDNIELLKRYSTNGMGPSQGKHSNMNGLRILARLTGQEPQQVGTTTARPFYHPVPMAHLAGRGFSPERRTPLHDRHQALGAVWMLAGVWQRPEYYAQPGKVRSDCIREEAQAVRQRVGLIDVGTLGKLEVIGPDAAEFLERVYVSRYANLKVGMSRYAVMCDEAGVLIDDGVVARLAEDHFYFTTTTSGAAAIYRELSRLNTLWKLDCGIVNHTGAFAAINLAGPKSRAVLARLTDLDLSSSAFPYLGLREATVAGIPARLLRVGFVGEWGYEIHVPASQGRALWDALLKAGQDAGIQPFGVEAQRLLRLEKGHVIVGQDSDGLSTPGEAGLDWAVKMDKPFFIGQRSLRIIAAQPRRQQLVGFMLEGTDERAASLRECHLAIHQGEIAGRITSIAWSPSLNRYIGLAYLTPALATVGQSLQFRNSAGDIVTASVVPTPFYDPDNLRQKEAQS